jgi:hypothetical protein
MANEVTIQTAVSYSKNGKTLTLPAVTTSLTVSGNGVVHGVKSIGYAAAEALALGGVTTSGYAKFRNLDATNAIRIGWDASGFVYFTEIPAGKEITVFLKAAPWAQALTAAVLLEYTIFDV